MFSKLVSQLSVWKCPTTNEVPACTVTAFGLGYGLTPRHGRLSLDQPTALEKSAASQSSRYSPINSVKSKTRDRQETELREFCFGADTELTSNESEQ